MNTSSTRNLFFKYFLFLILPFAVNSAETSYFASEEVKQISEIYTKGDWDGWLLGYQVVMNDGSSWFTERGPLDYWDWEIGDAVKIEPYNLQEEKKIFSIGLGYASHRIENMTRNELEEFRFNGF